tara:strand:- start:1201 stop:1323 length:123 start_codon:yes stop_codon:yes gene_type:complete
MRPAEIEVATITASAELIPTLSVRSLKSEELFLMSKKVIN